MEGVDNQIEIAEYEDYLLTFSKPKSFRGKNSSEVLYDKQFEEMCIFIQSKLNTQVDDKLTVLRFYESFEFIKKM